METTPYFCEKRKKMKKYAIGLLIISAGVLLLMFNFGVIPAELKRYIFNWQVLLIAIGVVNLVSKDSWVPGVILVSIGAFFLVPKLMFFDFNFVQYFWPLLLIGAGILIIFKRKGHKRHFKIGKDVKLESGYFFDTNIFSGSKQKMANQEFKGGKISNIFGGTELDLTQCTLAEGQNVLEVECIFGGVNVKVPSDWKINLQITTIMGGFSDKRTVIQSSQNENRELIIKGSAIFGGGEIKS